VAVGAGVAVGLAVRTPAEDRGENAAEGAPAGWVTWLQADKANNAAEVQTAKRAWGGITAGSAGVVLKTL